ncbi:hypothetical protein WICANDRAFT_94176 [Wickerhamomyces anomalus NRRL Y-366-8]|uniref:AAA+ ATPase domain-containing protein n=1 Tax=Wickerhamomyces anomalus (strain ATCC 58044 / CBS 1984 / NCYC 433 / NRRL Y-366-8) TaxID=683960 RepID=A0A1E3P141_WICAA|nr:uncharacterized protein WICANDRAFT_94176 [Wickerhamomyces anomalus NRRL Y-366-8]ODQ59199.1 hypothetical protein WICANDRAFT_94176 [Wickerhamomyces anomalus NRRL Y-366-8]
MNTLRSRAALIGRPGFISSRLSTRISNISNVCLKRQPLLNQNVRSFSCYKPLAFQYSRFNAKDEDGKDKKNKKDGKKNNERDYQTMGEYFKSKEFYRSLYLTLGLTLVFYLITPGDSSAQNILTFQEFKSKYLEKGLVEKVYVVNKYLVEAELRSEAGVSSFGGKPSVAFTIGSVDVFEEQIDEIQDRLKIPPNERIPVAYVEKASILNILVPFLPTVLLLGGLYYLTKRVGQGSGGAGGPMSGLFNVGKSKAKLFNQETEIKTKFKDVAGCDEAKEEIMEFVEFLKNPQKYEKLGAKIPRGAILSGPPGTGKTLLAKATAGEAGVPFLSVSGSEFVEMFVGVGASRVRDLFKTARKMAPAIIFVDEIDAIGKERGKGGMGGNDEREATLNQLLVEMDGFESSDHVVVLAGTNRPDVLDPALMRPGRFDRHVSIDRPDIEGRKAIYRVHLKKLTLKINEDGFVEEKNDDLSGRLAALTPGFSGADIANACNEAALIAARYGDKFVELRHFEQAIERVIAGLEKKSRVLSKDEKKVVAYHEAGHAICGWYLEYADPLLKVSIIPRGQGALGYAQYLPPDRYLLSTDQFKDRMTMALGGRVSEELHFKSVTSGAHDDFKKVTNIAESMVKTLGMSDKIGYLSFDTSDQGGFQVQKPFSEKTSRIIDLEVKKIVDECYERCKNLLVEKADGVEKVAQLLLEKEVLTRDDMIRLLGPRKFKENADFEKYLGGGKSAPPPPPEETGPAPV